MKKVEMIPVEKLLPDSTRKFAPVKREGVFAHSFECKECSLHFIVFSWEKNRHTAQNTYCPECGQRGRYIHSRKTISESKTFDPSSRNEIFAFCPMPGSEEMPDTEPPK